MRQRVGAEVRSSPAIGSPQLEASSIQPRTVELAAYTGTPFDVSGPTVIILVVMGARMNSHTGEAPEQVTGVGLKAPVADYRPVPAAYRRREFLEAISPGRWSEVLELCQVNVTPTPNESFHDAFARTLTDRQPMMLIDALECVAELGTEAGIDRIFDLETQLDPVLPADFPTDIPVAEQVLLLWCTALRDPELAARLAIARSMVLAKGGQRATIHFAGKEAREPPPWRRPAERRLRHALGAVLERRGAGQYLDIVCAPDPHYLRFFVVRGASVRAVVTVNATSTGRELTRFRPVVSDIISYDPATGRLALQLESRHMAREYCRAFGDVLFKDPEFFDGVGGWTLSPLQQRGRAALLGGPPLASVERVILRSFVWCPREGERIQVAGEDAFDLVERHHLPIQQGEIVEAKFHFSLHRTGRRGRATVTVRPPNVVRAADRDRDEVEEHLAFLGFFAAESSCVRDLWWAGDRVLPGHTWQRVLGIELHDAASRGWLTAAPLQHVGRGESALDPDTLTVDTATANDEGDAVAIAYSDEGDADYVEGEDLNGWRLDAIQIASALAHALRIEGAPIVRSDEIIDLGRAQIGSVPVQVFFAHRQPATASSVLAEIVRPRPPAHRVAVLVPHGRALDGCSVVPLRSFRDTQRCFGILVEALELHAEVPAVEFAPQGIRLVFDRERRQVWLDGLHLELTDGQFEFAVHVAIETLRQRPTATKELAGRIGSGRAASDSGRHLKREFVQRVQEVFTRNGLSAPELPDDVLIRSAGRGGGYVFTLKPFVFPSVNEASVRTP